MAVQVALGGAVFGLGAGLVFASMSNLIVHSVPANQTGAATGMNANIRTIGGAIGAAVTASLVTSHLQPARLPYASGYSHGFALLATLCVLAAPAALLVPVHRSATIAATAPAGEPAELPEPVAR